MKNELQLKLVEILTSIQSAAGKAGDFAMSQLPDIAQQYVVYGRVYSIIVIVTCLAGILCGLYVVRFAMDRERVGIQQYRDAEAAQAAEINAEPDTYKKIILRKHISKYDFEIDLWWAKFTGVAVSVFFGFCLLVSIKPAVMVWIAPKVWLINELAQLVK